MPAQKGKTCETVQSQLIKLLSSKQLEDLNNIRYGNLTVEIRDGVVYKCLVSNSLLVRTNEGKEE